MNGCKDDQSVRTDLPVNPNPASLYLSISIRNPAEPISGLGLSGYGYPL